MDFNEQETLRQIDAILSLSKGNRIDICYTLFELIQQAETGHKGPLLEHVALNFALAKSSDEIEIKTFIPSERLTALAREYGNIVDEILARLIGKNLGESDFYEQLWNAFSNPLFEDPDAPAFAMYYTLIDKRLPYFQLGEDAKRFADDDWRALNERVLPYLNKVRFILSIDHDQRSIEADLLLRELEAREDRDERIAMMGWLVHILRQEYKRLEKRLEERK
jgi:hypothetical protein